MVVLSVFGFRDLWFRGFGFGLVGVVSVSSRTLVIACLGLLID